MTGESIFCEREIWKLNREKIDKNGKHFFEFLMIFGKINLFDFFIILRMAQYKLINFLTYDYKITNIKRI